MTRRRVMRASNERFNKEGWLEADVMFGDAEGLTYRVIASGGSQYVVRRVLRAALDGEAEMWRRREPHHYALTEARDGDLIRVEGRLAKTQVQCLYTSINGMPASGP